MGFGFEVTLLDLGLWCPELLPPPNITEETLRSFSRDSLLLKEDADEDEEQDDEDDDSVDSVTTEEDGADVEGAKDDILVFETLEESPLPDGELVADLRADMLGFPALPELPCFGEDVPCFGLTLLLGTAVMCFGLL